MNYDEINEELQVLYDVFPTVQLHLTRGMHLSSIEAILPAEGYRAESRTVLHLESLSDKEEVGTTVRQILNQLVVQNNANSLYADDRRKLQEYIDSNKDDEPVEPFSLRRLFSRL